MRTIAIVSIERCTGKTTLACNLAVAFETAQRGSAAILDLDPQRSAHEWSQVRNRTPRVYIANAKSMRHAKVVAESAEVDLLLVDTPANSASITLAALEIADCAVMPIQPAFFDLLTARRAIDLCSKIPTPLATVINNAPPRGPHAHRIAEALSNECHVSPIHIVQRVAYVASQEKGLGVTELGPAGLKAASEIEALLEDLLDSQPS